MSHRISFVSDTHNQMYRLIGKIPNDNDILLHCGDWTNLGTEHEFQKELDIFATLPGRFKCATVGNHDGFVEKYPLLAKDMFKAAGVELLIDSVCEFEGVTMYGTPWSNLYGVGYAFQIHDSEQAERIFSGIPSNLDILLSHSPPMGILDEVVDMGIIRNIGSRELNEIILKVKPQISAFGHCHLRMGEKFFNGIHYVNSALCDDRNNLIKDPIIVEL